MTDKKIQDSVTQESKSKKDPLLGKKVKPFVAQATNLLDIHFDQLNGYQTVLFFYPQNGLPGVTQLAKDFAEHYPSFKQIKTCVFGVSIDTLEANQQFKDSLDLPFQLIADTELELSNWFKTVTERTIFGDPIKTNEQSSFLIDSNGKVIKSWRGPEVRGHVVEVVEAAHKASEGFNEGSTVTDEPQVPKTQAHEQLAAELAEALEI